MRGERKEEEASDDQKELKRGVPRLIQQGIRGEVLIGFKAEGKEHCQKA